MENLLVAFARTTTMLIQTTVAPGEASARG
jgi:hypothetical protein